MYDEREGEARLEELEERLGARRKHIPIDTRFRLLRRLSLVSTWTSGSPRGPSSQPMQQCPPVEHLNARLEAHSAQNSSEIQIGDTTTSQRCQQEPAKAAASPAAAAVQRLVLSADGRTCVAAVGSRVVLVPLCLPPGRPVTSVSRDLHAGTLIELTLAWDRFLVARGAEAADYAVLALDSVRSRVQDVRLVPRGLAALAQHCSQAERIALSQRHCSPPAAGVGANVWRAVVVRFVSAPATFSAEERFCLVVRLETGESDVHVGGHILIVGRVTEPNSRHLRVSPLLRLPVRERLPMENAVAFSADGELLAALGEGHRVWIYRFSHIFASPTTDADTGPSTSTGRSVLQTPVSCCVYDPAVGDGVEALEFLPGSSTHLVVRTPLLLRVVTAFDRAPEHRAIVNVFAHYPSGIGEREADGERSAGSSYVASCADNGNLYAALDGEPFVRRLDLRALLLFSTNSSSDCVSAMVNGGGSWPLLRRAPAARVTARERIARRTRAASDRSSPVGSESSDRESEHQYAAAATFPAPFAYPKVNPYSWKPGLPSGPSRALAIGTPYAQSAGPAAMQPLHRLELPAGTEITSLAVDNIGGLLLVGDAAGTLHMFGSETHSSTPLAELTRPPPPETQEGTRYTEN